MSAVVKKRASSARVRALTLIAIAGLAGALAGCSLTSVFEDKASASLAADPEITGSITPRRPAASVAASPFSPALDEEDWRRQRAALATALDPQGNGSIVRWDNPDSGAKGTFAPIGNAFVVQHEICRVFVASVISKGSGDKPFDDWHQGTACRVTVGEWRIRDHKPWKKPA